MLYPIIAKELIALKEKDLTVRQKLIAEGKLFQGYQPEMESVHLANAKQLEDIITEIGYPNIGKVGVEASQAAWFIIQHAISLPQMMKSSLILAEQEMLNGQIDPINYAFLYDRIAKYENRPQRYGTQYESDENGELTHYQLEDSIEATNERRKKLGLNTVEERTEELKKQIQEESEPRKSKAEIEKQKSDYDSWRKKAGWIK